VSVLQPTGDLRRSFSILRQQADRLRRILEISQLLTSTFDLEEVLALILSAATELTDTEAASILLLSESGSDLHFAASTGQNSERLAHLRVPVAGSLAGSILSAAKPMVIQDVRSDPRHFGGVDKQIDFESRSLLGVPLLVRDRPIGVLEALNKREDDVFSEEDGQVLMTLAAQAAYAQLNEVDQIKSNFIGIASHELRTPLGLILGYAAMLKDDANPETAEQLNVVLQSALRLRGLIDDMVNLEHVAEGQTRLQLEEFVLQDALREAVQAVHDLYTTKEQTLKLDLPAAPIRLKADREKIMLVINNLLTNAIKFTPAWGRVSISIEMMGHEVQVHVADTGIGIPADEVERVFERFYQVEPHLTRTHGGLGLGLAIAKGMIDLHGGRIWCESVVELGSRFSFALPIDGS
jgi:signal transduction histidine kinase